MRAQRDEPARWSNILRLLACAGVLALASAAAPAQQEPEPESAGPTSPIVSPREERKQLEQRWEEQYDQKDYAGAAETLRRLIEVDRKNFVPPYNLACMLAMQGKTAESTEALQLAVQRGFADLYQLKSDPQLEAIRHTEVYRGLIANWDTILAKRAELNLESAKEHFGAAYHYETDESLRLQYVAAFDAQSFAKAKEEIARLDRWWEMYFDVESADATDGGGGGGGGAARDSRATRPAPKDPWVMVILPTRKDYQTWAQNRYGPAWQQIGGAYSDDEKTLVAQDLGPTLRHEFWHVLHWRQMRRLGQMHPVWMMEGLCSLVEDVHEGPNGEMIVLPSWRTNMTKRLANGGGLTPWSVLFGTKHQRFVTSRPLAQYAQARTIFLYLAEKGKLKDWYRAYVAGYEEDPTGRTAFETVFNKPLAQIEKDYRAWVRALPEVAEEIEFGAATLPFDVEPGEGDGMMVSQQLLTRRFRGEARTGTGDIRARDIITAIDGKLVRDQSELVRVLGDYQPGQDVEVSYRRGKLSGTTKVTLIKMK